MRYLLNNNTGLSRSSSYRSGAWLRFLSICIHTFLLRVSVPKYPILLLLSLPSIKFPCSFSASSAHSLFLCLALCLTVSVSVSVSLSLSVFLYLCPCVCRLCHCLSCSPLTCTYVKTSNAPRYLWAMRAFAKKNFHIILSMSTSMSILPSL